MDYEEILRHLYSLESPKIKLGLGRIRKLLRKVGNPEQALRCIHVAGTNGKGSVCAMLFHALKEAGYKTGLYTSPHLKKFNERVRINEKWISDREIVDYFLKVKPFITSQSFFEITTAMAFLYFHEKKVDFLVLETGLGGRLDATNVVVPLVSVITNIELEHTELLGNAIEKIAFEKAGIIKNNVPVVTAAEGKALVLIKKIAKERKAQLVLAKKYPKMDFRHLNGSFQQRNKDIALTAISVLQKNNQIKITQKQIENGLKKTRWPGRLGFISKNVLADCAHNPSGFEMLKNELITIKKERNIKNFVFVVGIQKDKDIQAMLKLIRSLASSIIFTSSKSEKASNPQDLLKIYKEISRNEKINAKSIANSKKALSYAKKIAGKNDLVVVAGSIYLIGELI